jgi:hypothetical protein
MCQTTLRYDGEYLMVRFEPTTLLHIVMKTNPLLMWFFLNYYYHTTTPYYILTTLKRKLKCLSITFM